MLHLVITNYTSFKVDFKSESVGLGPVRVAICDREPRCWLPGCVGVFTTSWSYLVSCRSSGSSWASPSSNTARAGTRGGQQEWLPWAQWFIAGMGVLCASCFCYKADRNGDSNITANPKRREGARFGIFSLGAGWPCPGIEHICHIFPLFQLSAFAWSCAQSDYILRHSCGRSHSFP